MTKLGILFYFKVKAQARCFRCVFFFHHVVVVCVFLLIFTSPRRVGVHPSHAHANAGFPHTDLLAKRALFDGALSVPDVSAGFPHKDLFAKRSLIDGASSTSQMIRPSCTDQGSKTASVDAGAVTSGMVKQYGSGLDTAAQDVWVAGGTGVDRLRKLLLPSFLFSASARASKVTPHSLRADGSHHPQGLVEDRSGSSGLLRRWGRLKENVHSVHGSTPISLAQLVSTGAARWS